MFKQLQQDASNAIADARPAMTLSAYPSGENARTPRPANLPGRQDHGLPQFSTRSFRPPPKRQAKARSPAAVRPSDRTGHRVEVEVHRNRARPPAPPAAPAD